MNFWSLNMILDSYRFCFTFSEIVLKCKCAITTHSKVDPVLPGLFWIWNNLIINANNCQFIHPNTISSLSFRRTTIPRNRSRSASCWNRAATASSSPTTYSGFASTTSPPKTFAVRKLCEGPRATSDPKWLPSAWLLLLLPHLPIPVHLLPHTRVVTGMMWRIFWKRDVSLCRFGKATAITRLRNETKY